MSWHVWTEVSRLYKMAHLQQIRDPSFCFAEIDLLIRPLLLNTSLTSPFTSDPFRNTSCSSFHDALSEWEMEAPLPPPPRFQGEENKFVEAEACINEFKQDRESVSHFWFEKNLWPLLGHDWRFNHQKYHFFAESSLQKGTAENSLMFWEDGWRPDGKVQKPLKLQLKESVAENPVLSDLASKKSPNRVLKIQKHQKKMCFLKSHISIISILESPDKV